eukprot:ANDGO_07827.mRNA.1 hypothetical protein DICPUDRAFT_155334
MPLFETIPVDADKVRQIVLEHWSLELGACVKASQNHTFTATSTADSGKYIVRVTPDPKNTRCLSIQVELAFLEYLAKHGLTVCPAVATRSAPSQEFLRVDSLSICVFPFAKGSAVNYLEWRWMTEKSHVVALGRWIAQLHRLSKQFAVDHPDIAGKAREYSEIHDSILAEAPIDAKDLATKTDPDVYGLLHGDVNPSNYFFDVREQIPYVFDWDQVARGWFLYDLAQPIWGVVMLVGAGNPFDRSPVPQANVAQYTEWIVEGYESAFGQHVDTAALQRMVRLRRELYSRFCRRAVLELDPTSFMGQFCQYIVQWLDREDAAAETQVQSNDC